MQRQLDQCDICKKQFKSFRGMRVHRSKCLSRLRYVPSLPVSKILYKQGNGELVTIQQGNITFVMDSNMMHPVNVSFCSEYVEDKVYTKSYDSQSQSYYLACPLCLEESVPVQRLAPVCENNHLICVLCIVKCIFVNQDLCYKCPICRSDSLHFIEKLIRYIYYRMFLKDALVKHLHQQIIKYKDYGYQLKEIYYIQGLIELVNKRSPNICTSQIQMQKSTLEEFSVQRNFINQYIQEMKHPQYESDQSDPSRFITTQSNTLPITNDVHYATSIAELNGESPEVTNEYLKMLFRFINVAPLDLDSLPPELAEKTNPIAVYDYQFIETKEHITSMRDLTGNHCYNYQCYSIKMGCFANI